MLNSNFCLTARNYELQQEFGELAKKPSFDRRGPNPKPKRNGPSPTGAACTASEQQWPVTFLPALSGSILNTARSID
jgi:hypothetical protein